MKTIFCAFREGFGRVSRKQCIHAERKMRASLSEKKIDLMIEDSFPASDPPSTY
jgi:hypothetical protein